MTLVLFDLADMDFRRRSLVASLAIQLIAGVASSWYCTLTFGADYGAGVVALFIASSYLGLRALCSKEAPSSGRIVAVHILAVCTALCSVGVVIIDHDKKIDVRYQEAQMFSDFVGRLRADRRFDRVEAHCKGTKLFYLRGVVSSEGDLETLKQRVANETRSCFVDVVVEVRKEGGTGGITD